MLINARGKLVNFEKPKLMGIVNVTPDSFFDGGKYLHVNDALKRASQLIEEGVDILDVGAYSSRPGAEKVGIQEEMDRLIPVVEAIGRSYPDVVLSVDTFRGAVAEASIKAGAHIINDISGGSIDDDFFPILAQHRVPYVLMHSRGNPQTMQSLTQYDDIVEAVIQYFSEKIYHLRTLGIKDIILDPGFGFAKTMSQNYQILKRLEEFKIFELPIMGALSRKSMVYKLLNVTPAEALNGTTVLHTILLQKGVNMLRVHDVKEAKQVIAILEKIEIN